MPSSLTSTTRWSRSMGDGNPANYIAPLPSIGTPPDFYNQSAAHRRGHQHRHRGQRLQAWTARRQHPPHRHRGGDDPGRRQRPCPGQAGQGRIVPRRRAASAIVMLMQQFIDRRARCPDHLRGWSGLGQLRRRLPARVTTTSRSRAARPNPATKPSAASPLCSWSTRWPRSSRSVSSTRWAWPATSCSTGSASRTSPRCSTARRPACAAADGPRPSGQPPPGAAAHQGSHRPKPVPG